MNRLLSFAAFAAVTVASILPLSAAAGTHVHMSIGDHAPVRYERYEIHERYARDRYNRVYQPRYAYAPSARSTRDGRYIEPRRWIDRNGDGMDDRRGRRDLDRDGIKDRYDRDLDNDGIANRYDRDIDGDGVRNRHDRRPDNRFAY